MQNWQKERNYRKFENGDGLFSYVITVDGVDVEVSEDVYMAYSQAERRERYLDERDAGFLLSLDRMDEDGVLAFWADRYVPSAENIAMREMLIGQAMDALLSLPPKDRALIEAVVIDGVTEQEYATITGVSQVAVHKRKNRILKNILKNF
jgi:RNA polymerase sigma factor (sigma-70 family)